MVQTLFKKKERKNMGAAMQEWGLDQANNIIGAGMGMLLGKYNDERQLKQQRKLQQLQMEGSREMTDYQFMKQMEMWRNTSYEAQMEQIKKAGLNPGLLYGMAGAGGQTTGAGGGMAPTGATATQAAGGEIGMGMQMGLLQAQKRVLETQADKNEAEATKTAGVDTAVATKTLEQMAEEIQNIQAKRTLMKIQARYEDVQANIAEATEQEAVDTIVAQMGKAQQEVMQAEIKTFTDRATQNTIVDTIRRQYIKLGLENALIRAQTTTEQGKPGVQKAEIKLMDSQMDKISADIVQNWEKLLIEGLDQNARERFINNAIGNADMPDSSKELIDNIKGVLQAIILKGVLNKGQVPVKGFQTGK